MTTKNYLAMLIEENIIKIDTLNTRYIAVECDGTIKAFAFAPTYMEFYSQWWSRAHPADMIFPVKLEGTHQPQVFTVMELMVHIGRKSYKMSESTIISKIKDSKESELKFPVLLRYNEEVVLATSKGTGIVVKSTYPTRIGSECQYSTDHYTKIPKGVQVTLENSY